MVNLRGRHLGCCQVLLRKRPFEIGQHLECVEDVFIYVFCILMFRYCVCFPTACVGAIAEAKYLTVLCMVYSLHASIAFIKNVGMM